MTNIDPPDDDSEEDEVESIDDGDWEFEREIARREDEDFWANRPGGRADFEYDPIRQYSRGNE